MPKNETTLDVAYEASNRDRDRLEALHDWDIFDDIVDLEEDENWDWLKQANNNEKD